MMKYIFGDGSKVEVDVIVEEGIGATIKEKDSGWFILCINSLLSPKFKDYEWDNKKFSVVTKLMQYISFCVDNKEDILEDEVDRIAEESNYSISFSASEKSCPFS